GRRGQIIRHGHEDLAILCGTPGGCAGGDTVLGVVLPQALGQETWIQVKIVRLRAERSGRYYRSNWNLAIRGDYFWVEDFSDGLAHVTVNDKLQPFGQPYTSTRRATLWQGLPCFSHRIFRKVWQLTKWKANLVCAAFSREFSSIETIQD